MSKRDAYRVILREMPDWDSYLLRESGLPGPRGNLELAQAVADTGDQARFERYLAYGPDTAPVNSPYEFLAFCGVVGLGRLLAEGDNSQLTPLRHCAADPRWRMREGVAMALQRLGDADMPRLLAAMKTWASGTPLEQRAAAAALCEPRLLREPAHARATLQILDGITAAIPRMTDRRSDAFRALRQGLGYCWSVAVAALPAEGKPLLEKWVASPDPDVLWIMRENLKKARLERVDPEWVKRTRGRQLWARLRDQAINDKQHVTGLRSTSDLDLSWAIDLPRLNLCHEFAWSPGGKAIACQNTNPRIPEPQNVVYLIYPDLGTLRRITTPPGQYLLAWVPLITD